MFCLLRLNGPRKDERLQLDGLAIRLGRARSDDVTFDRERERVVGNYHAEIKLEDGSYVLYDLQSTHGTYINDQRVTRWRLQEGDIIGLSQQVGGPLLRFSRRVDPSLPVIHARVAGSPGPAGGPAAGMALPSSQPSPDEAYERTTFEMTAARFSPHAYAPERTAVSGAAPGRSQGGIPPVDLAASAQWPPPPPGAVRGASPVGGGPGFPGGATVPDYPPGIEVTSRLGGTTDSPGAPSGNPGDTAQYRRTGGALEPEVSRTLRAGSTEGGGRLLPSGFAQEVLPPWEPSGQGSTGSQPGSVGGASPPASATDALMGSPASSYGPSGSAGPEGMLASVDPVWSYPGETGGPPAEQGASGDPGRYAIQPGALLEPLELPAVEPASPSWGECLRAMGRRLISRGQAGGTPPFAAPAGAEAGPGGQRPYAGGLEAGERFYSRPFVLEEALKEQPRPEWIWMHRYRWPLRLIAVLMLLGWMYGDQYFRLVSGKPTDPVPMVESRAMREPLLEPPGAKNPELVRQVQALHSRSRSLPPLLSSDGDAVLQAMRPVLRRAGENSNFVPADFAERVADEIEVLRKQPDYGFIYTRSLKYQALLASQLSDAQLPEIFSFIPWLESGFVPSFSDVRVGRAGLWGLSAEVARRHGLTVEKKRDERLQWELETRAAASYLIELVGEVRGQSFLLAGSAFRKGPLGARGLLAQRSVWKLEEITFWSFYRQSYLPGDMLNYLTRLVAVATLNETPERFGLPPREALGFDRKAPPPP